MRSLFFFIPAIAIAAVFNTSCSKEEQVRDEVETSMVKISISTPGIPSDYTLGGVSTKGTGTAFNNQIEDNREQIEELLRQQRSSYSTLRVRMWESWTLTRDLRILPLSQTLR